MSYLLHAQQSTLQLYHEATPPSVRISLQLLHCCYMTPTIPIAFIENGGSHPKKSYALSFLLALRGFQVLSPFVNLLFKLLRCRCVASKKCQMAKKHPLCIDFQQALGYALLRDLLVSPTKLPSRQSNNYAILVVSTNRRCLTPHRARFSQADGTFLTEQHLAGPAGPRLSQLIPSVMSRKV